jgi:cell division protein FtsB
MSDAPEIEAGAPGRRSRPRRVSVQTTRERRRRIFTWVLSLTIGVLLVNAVVGEDGYMASLAVNREQHMLEAEVARTRRENVDLQQRRIRVEQDTRAVEEEARRQLNFIRPGETLIIVQPSAPAPAPVPSR